MCVCVCRLGWWVPTPPPFGKMITVTAHALFKHYISLTTLIHQVHISGLVFHQGETTYAAMLSHFIWPGSNTLNLILFCSYSLVPAASAAGDNGIINDFLLSQDTASVGTNAGPAISMSKKRVSNTDDAFSRLEGETIRKQRRIEEPATPRTISVASIGSAVPPTPTLGEFSRT